MNLTDHITGCILGTAAGDALGLPREGLSRRLFGDPPLRHAFLGRRGMCSDDTEHTIMVVQSLIRAGGGNRTRSPGNSPADSDGGSRDCPPAWVGRRCGRDRGSGPEPVPARAV